VQNGSSDVFSDHDKRQKEHFSMRMKAIYLVTLGALALPAAAHAHVSLHPNTVPAASFPTLNVRVPNEEDKASTIKVDMRVPPGFIDVPTGELPGWKAKTTTRKLAKPVTTDEGTVSEEVAEIIWKGDGKQGKIAPGSFLDFPISTSIPDGDAGKTLTFKTIQTYDNGDVTRWIGPPSADQPAPTINVTAKGGLVEDVAGTEAGPGKAPATATTANVAKPASSKGASKGLAIAALIVGIVGVVLGFAALLLARRGRAVASR
jgi:uncharacterized protein YcnI